MVVASPALSAQQKNGVQDSVQFYNKIKAYSEKRKFTKLLHRWIFRPTAHKAEREPIQEKLKPDYKAFEGKIIRKIAIETKDPFGFSFSDSTEVANSWLEKTGNAIHVKSTRMAIRNFLLLKENKPLDTLKLTESARLLRSQNYIREVRIEPKFTSKNQDSVDVSIIVLDSWSIIPKADISSSQTKLKLRERNFIGTGHQFRVGYSKRIEDGKDAFEASYMIPNFKNTFISATGAYSTDYDGFYEKKLSFDRIFYSPLTRWAGGLFLQEQYLSRTLPDDSLVFANQNFKFIAQDYWAGHSFRIFKGNTERERTTNLVLSARALFVDYNALPEMKYDSIRFFSDETFYLGSIGIASRQFVEDSYIFKDGIIEDVPVGTIYSLTGGIQNKNQTDRIYVGGKASYGNYFQWGFLSLNFELGSFFNHSKTEQATFSFRANYFSHLLWLGSKWKMRQFIKPQIVLGFHRLNSIADRLSLNENPDFNGVYGHLYYDQRNGNINGFSSPAMGISKYVIELQTQFYAPWEVLGFRFNPFVNISAGLLSDKVENFGSNRLYSSFGVGCVIRNDYLVFSSFQLSFAYYPEIPGQGKNIFKTNAFENDDFGFPNFQIGKPRTVIYK
ncbi:hypothetical protein F3C99_02000 [Vitellibacter sp. q18]|nr:hypothetical protein [Aequorivita lutea]